MSVYVLDANTVSFCLKDNSHVFRNIENALALALEHDLMIAPIAYYEVRRGLVAIKSEKRLKELERLCEMFSVGQLDNSILDIAADIYAELRAIGRIVDDADILIAAFCRHHNFTLVTNNMKHFENVADLSIVDWSSP